MDSQHIPFVEKANVSTYNLTKSLDLMGLCQRPHKTGGKLMHKKLPSLKKKVIVINN